MGLFFRTPTRIIKTVALTTAPEAIASVPTPATQAVIIAKKDATTDNVGNINIGPVSGDGQQSITIAPGGVWTLSGIDLSQWYIDVANAGDGVVAYYW